MSSQESYDEEITDPPRIPIRVGGLIKMRDFRDLYEATSDVGEDDVLWVDSTSLTYYGDPSQTPCEGCPASGSSS